MKLENSFTIPVSVDDAWKVLLDIERIAPCVPGATITAHEGDDYRGTMKVKLGPVSLTYNGSLKFRSRDEEAKVAVIEGSARETRGNGNAKAAVTCRLVGKDDSTDVFVETELDITGKPAQFGRGVFAEVAGTLIGKFADNLADEITASATVEAAPPVSEPAAVAPPVAAADLAAVRTPAETTPRKPAEPLDLLATVGGGKLKWLAPVGAAVALTAVAFLLLRRTRR